MKKITSNSLKASGSKLIRHATLLTLATFFTGCAGHVPVQPVADGTRIHVSTPESKVKAPDAKSAGESVGKGAAAGAGLGAGAGASGGFVASMACGPFFVICAPIMAGGGAAVGLIVGGTAGTVQGARLALPGDKADALDAIIAATIEEVGLSQRLDNEFRDQNADFWAISNAEEDIQVTLKLESFSIEQFAEDNLALHMSSTMVVRYGTEKGETADKVLFTYTGPRRHVDHWLENDGENFRAEIANAYKSNARQMIGTLRYGNGATM